MYSLGLNSSSHLIVVLTTHVTLYLQVSVNFSASDKEPGEEVSLIVEASPQSYVGVLAVDQSVLLLGGSNDFTQRQVIPGADFMKGLRLNST